MKVHSVFQVQCKEKALEKNKASLVKEQNSAHSLKLTPDSLYIVCLLLLTG